MPANNAGILRWFSPSVYLTGFDGLDPETLARHGGRFLYCDLDNTLVPHFAKLPTAAAKALLARCRGAGLRIWIVSNNTKRRVAAFCADLLREGLIEGFLARAWKPLTHRIKRFARRNGHDLADVVVLGDQLITDVLVANRLGCASVVVPMLMEPVPGMGPGRNSLSRFLEKLVYRRLEQRQMLISRPPGEIYLEAEKNLL